MLIMFLDIYSGYMSPEYTEDGIYSTKSDVFSFGVMVLEIICGKKNRKFHKYSENEESLINYVSLSIQIIFSLL